jgi:hypothetical protein
MVETADPAESVSWPYRNNKASATIQTAAPRSTYGETLDVGSSPPSVAPMLGAALTPPCVSIAKRMLPLVITLVYFALPITGWQVPLQVIIQTVEIVGLLCIIYGLRL